MSDSARYSAPDQSLGPAHSFEYARYLAAKESIDLRSVNTRVWDVFVDVLTSKASKTASQLEILEVGGGIGTMLKRLAPLSLGRQIMYTLLEIETENVAHFKTHVDGWLSEVGYQKISDTSLGKPTWKNDNGQSISVTVLHQDIHEVIDSRKYDAQWDVLIAQAFLDMFDLEIFLGQILGLLKEDGLFYFPINFDGITSFLPTLDPELDALVEKIYHNSMDARAGQPRLRGHSQSGRHLLTELSRQPATLLGAGGSDWLVFPQNGQYHADEYYFISQILNFMEEELEKSNEIAPEVADGWMKKRRMELAAGKLIYMAHQIDVAGVRKPLSKQI